MANPGLHPLLLVIEATPYIRVIEHVYDWVVLLFAILCWP